MNKKNKDLGILEIWAKDWNSICHPISDNDLRMKVKKCEVFYVNTPRERVGVDLE